MRFSHFHTVAGMRVPEPAGAVGLSVLLSLSSPALLNGQMQSPYENPPAAYSAAVALLEAGDTVGAIEKLTAATREAPYFGPAYLRLGALLSARAGELESAYAERNRAKEALEAARRLMGDDPEVLLEMGLLLRRQQLKGDAERVLNRAWRAAEEADSELPAKRRAEMHYALGRVYESWWDDWNNLVMIPASVAPLSCSNVRQPDEAEARVRGSYDHADLAVLCAESWAQQYERVVWLAELKSDERQRMVQHFRRAFQLDAAQTDAGFRLLGHLADAGEWEEYNDVAEQLGVMSAGDPRAQLLLALGLHETGREEEAEAAFGRALSLLPWQERAVFTDITLLLKRRGRELYAGLDSAGRAEANRSFFASTDPLFLTEAEERRLEHYSRLAWAELKFGDPATGERGWDSERGRIWVRYGRPWRQYQCCYGGILDSSLGSYHEGRREYWSYGERGPVFVFERRMTYRHARHTGLSKFVADDLAGTHPQLYQPLTITEVHDYPHQVARFRGSEPAVTRVEIYAAPPVAALEAAPGASLETGAFLLDASYRELWARRLAVPIADQPIGLSYQIEVGPGSYNYALEARRATDGVDPRPLARVRDTLTVAGFPAGQLNVSDLLLADGVRALVQRPSSRADIRIWPSRDLRFDTGEPISVYFEIYGLQTDAEGLARYRVEFAVEDAEQRNVVQRIASGLTELFRRGDQQEPRVAWDRVVEVADDRAIEYLTVELPQLEAGVYAVRVRVTDAVTGREVTASRVFRIDAAER